MLCYGLSGSVARMERSRMTDLCYHIPTAAMLDVSGCVRASMRVTACGYACDD
jgi:hypothetical protein